MARTAFFAPAHRVRARQPLGAGGFPAGLAPSVDWGGIALQDDRITWDTQDSAYGAAVFGWGATGAVKVTEQIPSAVATANIAALQTVTNGTAMTLVSSSGAGITVLASPFYCPASGTTIPTGTLVVDGLPGSGWTPNTSSSFIQYGPAGTQGAHTGIYDPTAGIARGLSITAAASATGGVITLSGYDWYGFPLTQDVTTSASTTVNTTKAFKFLVSATPKFTDGSHNYSIGTADIYGLNLAADYFADVEIFWNNVLQTSSTFTAAVTTTASATTGDVRGTFTAGSSSDGTKRLDIYVTPRSKRIAAGTLFGVAQA